jgi:dihydroorotase-like cyclic amidohydrolase
MRCGCRFLSSERWESTNGNHQLRQLYPPSPYDGRPVQGIVLKTFVDGRTVFTLEGERP